MKKSTKKGISWCQEKRYDFIAWHLNTHGTIRRVDLMKAFRISIVQASDDIKAFKEAYPGVLKYDYNDKHYVAEKKSNRPITTDHNGDLVFVIRA